MAEVIDIATAATSGCYDATRAAALSGVPKSTVYWWAKQGIVSPSVSPVQEMLWSYADLMSLRIVSWLRRTKTGHAETSLPASPMPAVRAALLRLSELELDLWKSGQQSSLLVDGSGRIFIKTSDRLTTAYGTDALPDLETFDLLRPFQVGGGNGPDLVSPRANLRIVPDRVVGEPHVADTRITTDSIFALNVRGFQSREIADMYNLPIGHVEQAIDLEKQLSGSAA